MRFAYFPGCKIPFFLKDYGTSFEALMNHLDVGLVKLKFNCCGYPVRGENFETSIFSSIKNLAIAEKNGLDIITPCKCCFGQFKHAIYWYDKNRELKKTINGLLDGENLSWQGKTQVKHLLSFLQDDYGLVQLQNRVTRKLTGKKIVLQYGCHALRPFSITQFDHPYSPTVFENLIRITGMEIVEWSKSLECCGNPLYESNKNLSLKILESKFKSASQAGVDYICSACTHCQMQYEMSEYETMIDTRGIVPILFTQVLGAALGIKKSQLPSAGLLPDGLS